MRSLFKPRSIERARRFADSVQSRVLAANVAENITVPSGAEIMRICATVAAYLTNIDDADDTDLVTNGAFAADTDWTKGTGWTISGGKADCDASQAGASSLEQTPTGAEAVLEEKAYRVVFTVSSYSAGNVAAKLGGGTAGTNRASDATFTETIVAGSNGKIELVADADFDGKIDDVSVTPIAHVPAADQTAGYASELLAPGIPETFDVATVETVSVVSAATCIITASFYGPAGAE